MGGDFDDRDTVSPGYSVALVARYPTAMLGRQFAPVDADDCAPAWVTTFDRSHPYALACIARQGDDSHDLPWDEVAYDMDRCGRGLEMLDGLDRQASPLRTDR